MKRVIILLFALFLFPSQLLAQPTEVTIYCDEAYPPYSYMEKGEAAGIYSDIVRAVGEKMPDYAITIEPVPWRRGLNYMQTGEGFALFPPYYRPEERPFMDYSVKMLDEELVVVVRDDSPIGTAAAWPEDFKDMRVGSNAGFIFMKPWRDKGIFVYDESPDSRTAILKIAHGRIDAYVNDRLAILSTVADMRASGTNVPDVRVVALLSSEAGYLGFSNQGGDRYPYKEDFIAQFQAAFEELEQSGEIQEIVNSYVN